MRLKDSRKLMILTMLLATLLVVSIYAWFTTNRDVHLNNLKGTVEVAESMEISLDAQIYLDMNLCIKK